MELVFDKNNEDLFIKVFYDLLDSYQIRVNKEYQFVYDHVFEHIMDDTNRSTEMNFKSDKKGDKSKYKLVVFKGYLYRYLVSKYGEQIRNPEKCQGIIKEIRVKKLKKINDNK